MGAVGEEVAVEGVPATGDGAGSKLVGGGEDEGVDVESGNEATTPPIEVTAAAGKKPHASNRDAAGGAADADRSLGIPRMNVP